MAPSRPSNRADRSRRRPSLRPLREDLESRVVPTGPGPSSELTTAIIPAGVIAPLATATPEGGSGSPTGYSPQQIRAAYGFDRIRFGSVVGDGSGQTIAIVDAYDDPTLLNSTDAQYSTSDLARFDRQYGLPDPPSFTKINEAGQTSPLPGTDPAGAGHAGGNWEYEEAMDVEWAHAMAPAASIVLVEANTDGQGDLYAALNTAAHLPGVSVVALSWGGAEFSGENYWDQNYQTPSGHQGMTFVASSGDAGAPGIFPAYSMNVVAVGGTELHLNADGSIQGETAWSGSGGGISAYESEPSYQKSVQNTGYRTIPDVAFDASGSTGVSVYDSYDNTGGGPWVAMWGTSLGAPTWAALIAVADQGRVAAGGTTLDGPSQTLPALYSVPSSDFHDITSGSNGSYSAGPGYDEVTGLGSPVANLLAPDLAYYGMSDHLVITAQPGSSVTAGQAFGLTISVERPDGSIDAAASGSLTISLASQPGGAGLGGTLTATIDQGVATFSGLSIDQAGSGYSISGSGGGFGSVTSSSFTATPAAASQLVIASQPSSSVTAGGGLGLTVDVEDAFGNLATGYSGDVTLSLAGGPGSGSLGGTLTVAASGGVASFSGLSVDEVGTGYTIEASGAGLSPTTTRAFAVVPAAPARLVIKAGPPSTVTAGSGFGLGVSIEDAYGNLLTGYEGTVSVALQRGPAGSTLSGPTSETVSHGTATFSGLTLNRSGGEDLLAVSSDGLGSLTTTPVRVVAAAPSQVVIVDQPPSEAIAGQPFGFAAAVEDPYGNLATGYSGTVTASLAKDPAGGSLAGPVSVNAVNGVASFSSLTVDQAGGGYAIEASSAGWSSSASTAITVAPAAPSRLVVAVQPPARVGERRPFAVGVEVLDAYGNVATGFDGMVTAVLVGKSGRNVLSGALSVQASGGRAMIRDASLRKAGKPYSITITSPGLTPASTSVFVVTRPGAGAGAASVRRLSGSASRRPPHAMGRATRWIHPRRAHHPGPRLGGSPHQRS